MSTRLRSQRPAPPTTIPTMATTMSSPMASRIGLEPLRSATVAMAMATVTTGAAMPSLSPLSTLRMRWILAGTDGSLMTWWPRSASVGASTAPMISARPIEIPGKRPSASAVPATMDSGRPTARSRRTAGESCSTWRMRSVDAALNRTSASVTSVRRPRAEEPGSSSLMTPMPAPPIRAPMATNVNAAEIDRRASHPATRLYRPTASNTRPRPISRLSSKPVTSLPAWP